MIKIIDQNLISLTLRDKINVEYDNDDKKKQESI